MIYGWYIYSPIYIVNAPGRNLIFVELCPSHHSLRKIIGEILYLRKKKKKHGVTLKKLTS